MRLRLAAPETVVDLTRVAELRGVREDGDAIVIGAMTTHSDVLSDPLIAQYAPLIAQATETVADRQVRHRGTFGGALAHADPAGDLPAVALALDAEFVIAGPERAAHGAGGGVLRRLPHHRAGGGGAARRDPRPEAARAVGHALREVQPGGAGVVDRRGRRGGPAGGRAHRRGADRADQHGPDPAAGARPSRRRWPARTPTAEAIAAAAEHAAEGTSPSSDLNAQADYRQHLATVLTRRAVTAAAGL